MKRLKVSPKNEADQVKRLKAFRKKRDAKAADVGGEQFGLHQRVVGAVARLQGQRNQQQQRRGDGRAHPLHREEERDRGNRPADAEPDMSRSHRGL